MRLTCALFSISSSWLMQIESIQMRCVEPVCDDRMR
jgi:hypothetical protein